MFNISTTTRDISESVPCMSPSTVAPGHSATAPVLSLIGNTPIVPLHLKGEGVTIFAKCEFLNPSGSIKDRFRPRLSYSMPLSAVCCGPIRSYSNARAATPHRAVHGGRRDGLPSDHPDVERRERGATATHPAIGVQN
jgi:hypothetical protein